MMSLQNFATAATSKSDVFTALGIDWKMFVLQLIGFLLIVWLLSKYIFPMFIKQVDERQAKIDEGSKAAEEAEKKAAEAAAKIEATMKQARSEAADIVSTAKDEAVQMVEKAESHAKTRSERIVSEAHEDIAKDVLAARRLLEKDTISLVKRAAGLAISGIADKELDTALVQKSVEGAKK